mgnify:CR=1 FL=1
MALTKVTERIISDNLSISGIATASNFKTGTTNVHNVGVTAATSVVGSAVTSNSTGIDVTGIVTATSFYGDISNATGAAAGLGTALSQTQTDPLNKIYYTDSVLSIGATITIDTPSSASAAYTQYTDIVADGADIIIADGDDFVPDILGISTDTIPSYSGSGGRVRAGKFTNTGANGAPTAPNGWIVTGVSTATTFKGAIDASTGAFSSNVTISGNLGVAGTITYEDVARVDATGISTFREGYKVGPLAGIALTAYKDGSIRTSGIITAASFSGTVASSNLSGALPALDGSSLTGINTAFGNSSINSTGIITATAFVPSAGQLSNRNLVINGNMRVAQRGDTTGVQDGYGGCDRFKFVGNTAARATLARTSGTTLNGFGSCQLVNCTTADTSLAAGDYHYLGYRFEGQDLFLLKKGTANAESVTLQFWVSSPKTGIHIIQLYDNDNGRHISKSYTVSTANTWEKKILTFAGDTTGALDNNADYSLQIYFWLLAGSNYTSGSLATSWSSFTAANAAVGQVNCLDNTSNNFKLTGVQLEVGSVATPFEHRSYGEELIRCQRYYQMYRKGSSKSLGLGFGYSANELDMPVSFITPMRAAPIIEQSVSTSGWLQIEGSGIGGGAFVNSNFTIQFATEHGGNLYVDPAASITVGAPYHLVLRNAAAYVAFSSEI